MYCDKYDNISSRIMDFDSTKSYNVAPIKYYACVWTIEIELLYRHPLEKPLRFWASSNFL